MKSWVIPEGNGGTSGATRPGQEAAFWGIGSDMVGLKKTMATPAHIRIPKYLSCLSMGRKREGAAWPTLRRTTIEQRDGEGAGKQPHRTEGWDYTASVFDHITAFPFIKQVLTLFP